jgi:hypothetical protein
MSGRPRVRDQRAVAEAGHAVHDRLRVHDHLDARVGDAEQVVGLDQLQPFVHQGGRVDRDLCAHRPGGMGQGLGRDDVCQPFLRPAPERAARRCQHQRLERLRGSALQALLQRRVLAVDRQQQTAAAAHGGGHQLAARHQALLVGEGQIAARVERRHRGLEPGGANDRVQHDVGSELAHQLDHAARPAQHPAIEFRARAFGDGGIGQRDHVGAVLARSRDRLGVRSVRGQAGETQVRVVANDLERLTADRAGRAQNGHRPHGVSVSGPDCGTVGRSSS